MARDVRSTPHYVFVKISRIVPSSMRNLPRRCALASIEIVVAAVESGTSGSPNKTHRYRALRLCCVSRWHSDGNVALLMSSSLDQECRNGLLSQFLACLQPMEALHKNKTLAISSDEDRTLQSDL